MNLAEKLNALEVDASSEKGVVTLNPQAESAFTEDGQFLPEHHWLWDCEAYIDRDHSDYPFTYYVEYEGKRACWDFSECEWTTKLLW